LPEILGGVRIGFIRAVKGVIIGQLLISIVGFGALFELLFCELSYETFLGSFNRPVQHFVCYCRISRTPREKG